MLIHLLGYPHRYATNNVEKISSIVYPSIRFPQDDSLDRSRNPSLATRSNNCSADVAILYSLFHECYYSYDYLGALKILTTLAEITPLDATMFQYFIDIISNVDVTPLATVLVPIFLKASNKVVHLTRGDTYLIEYHQRINRLLHFFIEKLILSNDIDSAVNIMQSRASHRNFVHSDFFQALHTNVLLIKLMSLAIKFNEKRRLGALPSVESVIQVTHSLTHSLTYLLTHSLTRLLSY